MASRRRSRGFRGQRPAIMLLTIIGCGDAFGAGGQLQTSFHVRSGSSTFLIDCGVTTLIGMHRLGLATNDIDMVCVSHLHGDHFGGLAWLLIDAQYGSKRERPLIVTGPKGIKARFRERSRGSLSRHHQMSALLRLRLHRICGAGSARLERSDHCAFRGKTPLRCAALRAQVRAGRARCCPLPATPAGPRTFAPRHKVPIFLSANAFNTM